MFLRPFGAGFFIVVESKGGTGGQPGTTFFNSDPGNPSVRPDLQMEATRNLGNGSAGVCDSGGLPPGPGTPTPARGGVPGINPPSYDPASQHVADALNDLGCRFIDTSSAPCTKNPDTDVEDFVKKGESTKQACTATFVSTLLLFPKGDTLLTVRWRDVSSNLGNPASIVVRVP